MLNRGGLTTKIHAIVDADGLPINLQPSEGQAYDGHSAHTMLDTLQADMCCSLTALPPAPAKVGDADSLRAKIAKKGAWAKYPADTSATHVMDAQHECVIAGLRSAS